MQSFIQGLWLSGLGYGVKLFCLDGGAAEVHTIKLKVYGFDSHGTVYRLQTACLAAAPCGGV